MAQDIRAWLGNLGLGDYAESFAANGVDLRALPHLSEDDLRELGVLLGHRRVLLAAIADLSQQENASLDEKPASLPPAPVDAPIDAATEAEAERRQLTVMFCDLVGSTALSDRLDPEDLRAVMRSYQDAVTAAVTRYEGHVAKYLGDGLLVYFGWPQAQEDQAERALRAGLDAVEAVASIETEPASKLKARVGIASGEVVIGDLVGEAGREAAAVTGDTPNLAARLQQRAEPGQVVIAQATRALAGSAFELEALGAQRLKGFAAPLPAWRVVSARPLEARFEARLKSGGRKLTPFVGRAHELGLLLDRWEQAKDGDGQVVLLSGEPGIGKSRLLQALSERLGAEPRARLRYQCAPYQRDNALYPIVQHYLHALRVAPGDDDAPKLDRLERLLTESGLESASAAPILALMLSLPAERYDLPAMTPEQRKAKTFETLLDHLAALARDGPLLMLFEDAHWIDPTTEELLQEAVSLIAAQPVMLVVTQRPDWQASFVGTGHATPLVLNRLRRGLTGELVRATGGGALPDATVAEIVARADGIPLFVEELTQAVLEAGTAETKVPESLQASLLARLDRLGPAKQVAQVAAAIGREFERRLLVDLLGETAADLQASLDRLVSSGLLYEMGRGGHAGYAFKHALVHQAAYDSLLKSRRRRLHAGIARALAARAPEQASLLARHWERAGDLEQAFIQRLSAAEQAAKVHAIWESVSESWAALTLLDRVPPSPQREARRIEILLRLIAPANYFWRSDEERSKALRHLDAAIDAAAEAGRLAALARLQAFKAVGWGDELLLSRAVENADASGDKRAQAAVAERGAIYFGIHGLFERSHEHTERAIAAFRELGEKAALGHILASPGRCYYARAGRLDDSLRCAGMARALAEEIGTPPLKAWLAMEAEPFLYKGEWEEARKVVEQEGSAAWDIGAWDVILWTSAWAAIACLKLRRVEDAEALIARAFEEPMARSGTVFSKVYIHIALAQLQLAKGDAKAAIETARQALDIAEQCGNPLERGAAHRVLAEALAADGDDHAADTQFRSSLEILGRIQSPPELAQSLLAYGRFQRETNAEEGRALLARALAIFEELGSTGWIEEAQEALAPS